MYDSFALWFSMASLVFFTLFMMKRIYSHFIQEDKATNSLIFALDNIRYISVYLSFSLTAFFGMSAGAEYLKNFSLAFEYALLAHLVILAVSIIFSMAISTMLIYAERTIGEGGLTPKQTVSVAVIYLIVAFIDFSTLRVGFNTISEQLEKAKIETSVKVDKKTSLVLNTKESIVNDLQEQLKSIKRDMKNVNNLPIVETATVKSLNRTLIRCQKKKQKCPLTHGRLDAILKVQHVSAYKKMQTKREKILNKIEKITQGYENTAKYADKDLARQRDLLNSETDNIKSIGFSVAFIIVVGGLLFSIARSFFKVDKVEEAVEEKEVHSNSTDDKRHYILQAMKERIDDNQLSSDMGISALNFPINATVKRAKAIALGENKIITISNSHATEWIRNIKRDSRELEEYLHSREWNNIYDTQTESRNVG